VRRSVQRMAVIFIAILTRNAFVMFNAPHKQGNLMSSHILSGFNRLSKWIVNIHKPDESVALSVIPDRSSFIQLEALPPYMDRLYHRLGARSDKTFRPENLRFEGLFGLSAIKRQNRYVEALKRTMPHHAKDIMMAEGPLLSNPNLSDLPERERKAAELVLAKILYFQGMNPEVYNFFTDYISACQPDEDFVRDEDDKIKAICESILMYTDSHDLVLRMTPKKLHTRDSMETQYYLRHRFMQAVADEIAAAHGHPSVPVILDEFPPAVARANAFAIHKHYVMGVPKTGIILIDAKPATINSVPQMINLVGHEMRHILDYKLSHAAKSYGVAFNDPNCIHAGMIALNEAAYMTAPLAQDNALDKKTLSDQFNRYAFQYMERAARNFGEKLENNLAQSLPAIFDPTFEISKMCAYSVY
jgi:hypothetical protein